METKTTVTEELTRLLNQMKHSLIVAGIFIAFAVLVVAVDYNSYRKTDHQTGEVMKASKVEAILDESEKSILDKVVGGDLYKQNLTVKSNDKKYVLLNEVVKSDGYRKGDSIKIEVSNGNAIKERFTLDRFICPGIFLSIAITEVIVAFGLRRKYVKLEKSSK